MMDLLRTQTLQNLDRLSRGKVWLVGGTVRDLLVGSGSVRDIDVVMEKGSDLVAQAFAHATGGSFFYLDKERHITRVMVPGSDGTVQFDFADFEGPDLLADLGRRDFTINAMAVDLREYIGSGSLEHAIDPFGGRADIRNRVIRIVAPRVLDDDPLRLLRAVRFSATLGFTIERVTRDEIRARSEQVRIPSTERVRDELFGILAADPVDAALETLESLGLLRILFPELDGLRDFAPGKHHQYDILTHSFRTAGFTSQALDHLTAMMGGDGERVRQHLQKNLEHGITRMMALRFACLLHDMAKGETYSPGLTVTCTFTATTSEEQTR